jgi:pSer/pThr/pTyr-binding forkhead associated (FHA) protein
MEAKLVILEGKFQGCEIPIPNTVLLIGRDSQCHVQLHSPAVSKRHCAIAAWAGKVRVRDLKSRNGTYVNGQPVVGEVTVKDGDQLQVGTHLFQFQIVFDQQAPDIVPVDEEALDWLLRSPHDSRHANGQTAVLAPASKQADLAQTPPGTVNVDESSRALSAGRLMRDFLAQRAQGLRPS